VLLLGVVCAVVGGVGTDAREEDPRVLLLITDERPDRACTVTFEDPFTGAHRLEPYRCDPDRGGRLSDLAFARVVSWGQSRGDLYPVRWGTPGWDVPSEPVGSPGWALVEGVETTGLVLVPLALIGGAVRLERRRRRWMRARPAAPGGVRPPALAGGQSPPRVVAAGRRPGGAAAAGGSPGAGSAACYARLSAHAERTARPAGGVVPERDWRKVAWWRVRGLQRLSGLGAVYADLAVVTVGGSLTAGLGLVVRVEEEDRGILSVLLACVLLRALLRAARLYRGLPALRNTLGVASAAVAEHRRYVLVSDRPKLFGEARRVTLVVYPTAGGDEALPEGVLEVFAPGPALRPMAGLPAPTGTVELLGAPDGGEGDAVVVPRIGDTVLWPAGLYQRVGPDGRDRRGVLDAVVAS
jgi:hypothetical protein